MASKRLKILVACGSGICTSTVAGETTKEVCKEYGVEADVTTCTLIDVPGRCENFDIVLTANRYQGEISVPLMNVFAFVTGINEEATREKLGKKLQELANE